MAQRSGEALISQQLAALAMLRECIERCPPAIWVSGPHPRSFWRVAYHALYYGHLYLQPDPAGFVPWEKHVASVTDLWGTLSSDPEAARRYVPPPEIEPYSQAELLAYLDSIALQVQGWIEAADLEAPDCGIEWYPNFPKHEHLIMNVRHMQGHVGQLSERLMDADPGIELSWIGRRSP